MEPLSAAPEQLARVRHPTTARRVDSKMEEPAPAALQALVIQAGLVLEVGPMLGLVQRVHPTKAPARLEHPMRVLPTALAVQVALAHPTWAPELLSLGQVKPALPTRGPVRRGPEEGLPRLESPREQRPRVKRERPMNLGLAWQSKPPRPSRERAA